MKTSLIIVAAGKGERAKFGQNKLLVPFGGITVLERTLNAFYKTGLIDEYIIAVKKEEQDAVKSLVPSEVKIVVGGKTRSESVKNALSFIDDGIVLIHDGARPFVSERIISDCINTAKAFDSAITVMPSRNTICMSNGEIIQDYLGKSELFSVQTPQAFDVKKIKKAYMLSNDKPFNDDGEVYKTFIGDVHTVLGEAKNVKLTFPEDFEMLGASLPARIGVGFDCHRLVENRKLILGGIEIPHDKGLLGHSDADVLTHAVMDAMLSAISCRDIGYHFPDSDEKYKDANSMELLKQVLCMVDKKGYRVNNLSAVIMAEKPKLLKHIPAITQNLSKAIGISPDDVGIGATTLEGLGFVGREEGISVKAVVSLIQK